MPVHTGSEADSELGETGVGVNGMVLTGTAMWLMAVRNDAACRPGAAQAWVKVGLAEGGRLRSKKLPSVALELIVLRAYEQEVEAGGPRCGCVRLLRAERAH